MVYAMAVFVRNEHVLIGRSHSVRLSQYRKLKFHKGRNIYEGERCAPPFDRNNSVLRENLLPRQLKRVCFD